MKLMRRRRRILLLGLLAVCVLTGVLVAAVSRTCAKLEGREGSCTGSGNAGEHERVRGRGRKPGCSGG